MDFKSLLCGVLLLGLVATVSNAQHTGFTLLGEPNAAAADVPAEQVHVHPMTSPYFNEDAFITTDVRAWYLFHDFAGGTPIAGGHAQILATQVRVALTDRIGLLAVKDGHVWMDSGLVESNGWNDVAAAIKWNFIQDWEKQLHVAVGAGYEFRFGESKVLQNDDEARLFVSANKGFDKLHLGANVNVFFPVGDKDPLGDSTRLQWHLHADYWVCEWFSPAVEFNGYHVLDADTSPLPFQGLDVGNFGSGAGDPVVTAGIGGEVRCPEVPALKIRAAYETPLTDVEHDLFNNRWTFSVIWSF